MAVHLITGFKGEEHIQSADQGSFNASFFGDGEFIMEAGNQCEASIINNNTVRILDGDILMKGRHIRIPSNTYIDMTIQTGTAGVNRNDLIVMEYSKDAGSGIESADLKVVRGTATEGTAVDPAYTSGDILGGAILNQMPLYRVRVEGVVLSSVEQICTVIPTYKKLAEQYAKQFEEACNTYLGALNILDSKEEIEANTKENQLAGALALKEVIASISDIVNNQVTTRYDEETDMWQMKTVSDGIWHDWKQGGLLYPILYNEGYINTDIARLTTGNSHSTSVAAVDPIYNEDNITMTVTSNKSCVLVTDIKIDLSSYSLLGVKFLEGDVVREYELDISSVTTSGYIGVQHAYYSSAINTRLGVLSGQDFNSGHQIKTYVFNEAVAPTDTNKTIKVKKIWLK